MIQREGSLNSGSFFFAKITMTIMRDSSKSGKQADQFKKTGGVERLVLL